MRHHLTQNGDTIVEVLIVIAIISLVLVGAYISTNRNIASTQDAQERTQAVKLVQTQIEYLRTATSPAGTCYAFAVAGGAIGVQRNDGCIVNSSDVKAGSGEEPAYTLTISSPDPAGTYTVKAVWDSITGTGQNNVTMYYQP